MKRILFLDDCQTRQKWAKRELGIGNALYPVETAGSAILSLAMTLESQGIERDKPYDEVYLDHDLNGETYCDSDRKDCGMEVVRWIVANKPKIEEIIVHTLNNSAGVNMTRALKLAGYKAKYRNFLKLAGYFGD